MVVFPVFVTVAFCEALLPTVTFPKLKLDGLIEKDDVGGGGFSPPFPFGLLAVTTPEHPLIALKATVAANSVSACQTRVPAHPPSCIHFAQFDTWNRCAIGLDLPRRFLGKSKVSKLAKNTGEVFHLGTGALLSD
jgi:hypothetical protein